MATEKAYLEPEKGEHIPCMFNPAQLSFRKTNSWVADEVPGRSAPDLYFAGGGAGRLSLSLVLDTTRDGTAVTTHTSRLLALMDIDETLPGHDSRTGRGRPPWVRFHWSDLHSFKAVVESLELDFTYFAADGTPLRARADLSLRQFVPEARQPRQNPTSGTPEPHRVHQVQAGETLDRIAATYYGDSTRWRTIAEANGMTDPLDIVPGTLLALPVLHAHGD